MPWLKAFKPKPEHEYIIASDNSDIHRIGNELSWIKKIIFTEKAQSLFTVAPDVVSILTKINSWFELLSTKIKGIPSGIVFWETTEAVNTTLKIQDALLLIQSDKEMLVEYGIKSIIILDDGLFAWENKILEVTANSLNVLTTKVNISISQRVYRALKYRLRNIIKEIYHIIRIFNIKFFKKKLPQLASEFIFQLSSPDSKHLSDIEVYLRLLEKQNLNPKILCWKSGNSADVALSQNLPAENLEYYIPVHVLFGGIYVKLIRNWLKIKKSWFIFSNSGELRFSNINIGPLLTPWIFQYFLFEIPERYRFYRAMKRFVEKHHIDAIRPWGHGFLYPGVISCKIFSMLKQRPFIFFYHVGMFTENAHAIKTEPIDLFFAPGSISRNFLEHSYNIPPDKIAEVGVGRYDIIKNVIQQYPSPEQSRKILNIPEKYSSYVCYSLDSPIRGYVSLLEITTVNNILNEIIKRFPNVALIIKPHPSCFDHIINNSFNQKSGNIFMVPKNSLPYHAINSADMLICKFSTLGLEAMLFRIPTISTIFDQEPKFKYYGDAAEYFYKPETFRAFLEKMLNNTTCFKKWKTGILQRQELFLKNYFPQTDRTYSQLGADAIMKYFSLFYHRNPLILQNTLR